MSEKAKEYLVRDPEDGIEEEFPTLKEAIEFANECIQSHLDDGWNEAVENITISEISHRAMKCEVRLKKDCKMDEAEGQLLHPDGTYWANDEYDEMCNYKMFEV